MTWTDFSIKLKQPIVIVSSHTLGQCVYIEFLTNEKVSYLKGKRVLRNSILQQDGEGLHTWPQCSPDLSPLDFFLWGCIKNTVYYVPRAKTSEKRVKRIRTAYNDLPQ